MSKTSKDPDEPDYGSLQPLTSLQVEAQRGTN